MGAVVIGDRFEEERDMEKRATVLAVLLSLVAFGAAAAKAHEFFYGEAGLGFSWDGAAKPGLRRAGEDLVIEGSRGGITLKVVVRSGERLPEAQHRFRLMSYFPGEWNRTPDDCRGQGWEKCGSWAWTAERTSDRGLGMAGYGPGGTYLVVLSSAAADFERLRPGMRDIQSSLRLK
jgi:hypothetical protein